ncbi:MAG: hypothetical protein RBT11_11450 [Desulfobacterales bacterium]|jgi:flagellar hook protein FlgE|nr:hypothetical protein [Desulfobacterales bacterium]
MVGSISANAVALATYGKEMATVSDQISKAFRENSDVNGGSAFAKTSLIENGHRANLKTIQAQGEMLACLLNIIA